MRRRFLEKDGFRFDNFAHAYAAALHMGISVGTSIETIRSDHCAISAMLLMFNIAAVSARTRVVLMMPAPIRRTSGWLVDGMDAAMYFSCWSFSCCDVGLDHLRWIDHAVELSLRHEAQLQRGGLQREVVVQRV